MSRQRRIAMTASLLVGLLLAGCQDPGPTNGPEVVTDDVSAAADGGADDGWSDVQARCILCHSLRQITSTGGDERFWQHIVDWMERDHGLQGLDDATEERIVRYLAREYGPRTPTSSGQAVRRAPLPGALRPSRRPPEDRAPR